MRNPPSLLPHPNNSFCPPESLRAGHETFNSSQHRHPPTSAFTFRYPSVPNPDLSRNTESRQIGNPVSSDDKLPDQLAPSVAAMGKKRQAEPESLPQRGSKKTKTGGTKPPPKAKAVKVKVKEEAKDTKSAPKRGRKTVEKYGLCVRNKKALKAKFDSICRMEKPTGDVELPEYVERAWTIEDRINAKSGTVAIDDLEWDEGKASDAPEVIEIPSDDEDDDMVPLPKGSAVAKAYHVNPPLHSSTRRPRSSAATDALSLITSIFNPAALKDRDESRLSQMVQMNQLNVLPNCEKLVNVWMLYATGSVKKHVELIVRKVT
ncbi:hypothetical protein BJ138DRAFT_1107648 [Hygrophoropsis aurantiaca]|uniref:Uncharacterized protein n=1 Tax=Hygrophoropsis aurantiaca TaxID=72124 RepID=A0ACB7ZQW3_9AGAM|nr:hypothetical protein BJ138DRAFT_1107648 [Hygrophoropsis aurantiaca]